MDGFARHHKFLWRYFRKSFRYYPDRDDITQECVCIAWQRYARLQERGIDPTPFIQTFARRIVHAYKGGRRFACIPKRDVLHFNNRIRAGYTVGSFRELTDERATPSQQAICNLDFETWKSGLDRKRVKILEKSLSGWRTQDIAKRHHLTPGRISQVRKELRDSLSAFWGAENGT